MMPSRRKHRRRTITRLMAVALVFAVAWVFTPCCELFAAIDGTSAMHADVHSAPGADPHAPEHWCGAALDEIASPIADLAPTAANGNAPAWHVAHSYTLSPARPLAAHRLVLGLGTVGPPLYLRLAHLLL
jgi:hypothetical protein